MFFNQAKKFAGYDVHSDTSVRSVKSGGAVFYDITSVHNRVFFTQLHKASLKDIRNYAADTLGDQGISLVAEVFSKTYDSTLGRIQNIGNSTSANILRALDNDSRFKKIQRACEGSPSMSAAVTRSLLEDILDTMVPEQNEEQNEEQDEGQDEGQEQGAGAGAGVDGETEGKVQRVLPKSLAKAMKAAQEKVEEIEKFASSFGCQDPETREQHEDRDLLIDMLNERSLKEIMDIAGKVVPMAASKVRMNVERGIGEYTKLTTSDNIVDAVLSDIALLASDFSALGMKKIAEKELVTWDKELREQQGKGPIVFCIDHSASMHGSPLEWAKALLLGLARFAALQNRPFAVVWFNHLAGVKYYPVGTRPTDLLAEMNVDACGGTNFDSALGEAVEAIKQTPNLKGADLVFLTDGCDLVDTDWKAEFDALNVNALGVAIEGDTSTLETFCDQVLNIEDLTVENAGKVFDGIKM